MERLITTEYKNNKIDEDLILEFYKEILNGPINKGILKINNIKITIEKIK